MSFEGLDIAGLNRELTAAPAPDASAAAATATAAANIEDTEEPLVSAPPATDEALDVSFSDICTTEHDSECYAVFEVRRLDRNGDGFLAVRTGPGTNFLMTDQLFNGDKVTVMLGEIQGPWLPIIYGDSRKGWAHRKWLFQISG
jgi:hypothetical protein